MERGVKRQWGNQKRRFSGFSDAVGLIANFIKCLNLIARITRHFHYTQAYT